MPTRTERPDPADRADTAAAERTRRAFARRQWRRRWLAWRRVGVGVLVLAVLAGGGYAVWFSSWLAVSEVRVRGVEVLTADAVRAAADVPDGTALATVDLPAVEARVEALAAVASATVTRQWPDGVLVEVEERETVAVVELGGTVRGMDEDGVVFRTYRRAPAGVPRVEAVGVIDAEALTESAQVVAALPDDLAVRIDHVQVGTVDRIALVLRDGRRVVWGSAEDSARKADVLERLISRRARTYDVSVPGRPTTRD
ncbi:cell division protein FtsQ/DivIB [Nocardioides pantholopis]|uniref:cell division protein FtsQ/DivIB n=1 Tax=Nocardioides pantholopis TaxID=2483798 RepID=UPI001F157153|nr:FtsQ-type POTRA domain-containing protein [Nocardioides pantholopis]